MTNIPGAIFTSGYLPIYRLEMDTQSSGTSYVTVVVEDFGPALAVDAGDLLDVIETYFSELPEYVATIARYMADGQITPS